MNLAVGTELADGRYRLTEHLGSGGMASVWLARDTTLERDVAIKVMSDLMAGDERWLKRFEREARAAASLQHPNVVKVFDFGVEDARPYLIMAYVAGGTLKERLAEGDRIDGSRLARELLGALAHVHGAGLLHRDIKPANILLDADGASHLTDFGIARQADATELTQTGVVLGTASYLAPEVLAGGPATERSDLYSAGCVLEEAGGPRALTRALTADDPVDRPPSAADALRELEEPTAPQRPRPDTASTAVVARPTQADPGVTQAGWTPRHARRSPWFVPAAALAAIAVLAIVVVVLASGRSSPAPPTVAPSNAPLDQQLDQLDKAIDAAR